MKARNKLNPALQLLKTKVEEKERQSGSPEKKIKEKEITADDDQEEQGSLDVLEEIPKGAADTERIQNQIQKGKEKEIYHPPLRVSKEVQGGSAPRHRRRSTQTSRGSSSFRPELSLITDEAIQLEDVINPKLSTISRETDARGLPSTDHVASSSVRLVDERRSTTSEISTMSGNRSGNLPTTEGYFGFEGVTLSSEEDEGSEEDEDEDEDTESDDDKDSDAVDKGLNKVTHGVPRFNTPSVLNAPTPFCTISEDPFASIPVAPFNLIPSQSESMSHAETENKVYLRNGTDSTSESPHDDPAKLSPEFIGILSSPVSSPSLSPASKRGGYRRTSRPDSEYPLVEGGNNDVNDLHPLTSVQTPTHLSYTNPPPSDTYTLGKDSHNQSGFSSSVGGTTWKAFSATSTTPLNPITSSSFSASLDKDEDIQEYTDVSPDRRQEQIDQERLSALGYDQVLGRDYDLWTVFSLCYLNIGVLQGTLFGVLSTWTFGGPLTILAVWPIGGVILVLITLSMAEINSSYPICGAFPSWTWRICRNGIGFERQISWAVAGLVLLYHIGVSTLLPWQLAMFIGETIQLGAPTYALERWHVLLYSLLLLVISATLSSIRIGRHPWLWKTGFVYSIAVWLALMVSLLAKTNDRSASSIFRHTYAPEIAWHSKALVYALCLVYTSIATGVDAASHFAEEVRNPSRNLPIAMIGSTVLSYSLGYIGLWVFLLVMDGETIVIASESSFPAGAILTRIVGQKGGIALLSLILVAVGVQCLVQLQSSARYIFSISRDQALPFAYVWGKTNKAQLPSNALWLITGVTAPLMVALWASPAIVTTVVTSSAATGCLLVYSIPVVLYVASKLNLQYEDRTAFTLRRWSKPVAIIASTSVAALIVILQIPRDIPVTANTFSWSMVVTAGVLILSTISWMLYGRFKYSGPIRAITAWTAGKPISLQDAIAHRSAPQLTTAMDQTHAFSGAHSE